MDKIIIRKCKGCKKGSVLIVKAEDKRIGLVGSCNNCGFCGSGKSIKQVLK